MPLVTADLVKGLCNRTESTKLDFKSTQYRLTAPQFPAGSTPEYQEKCKAECVKDIVAMANSAGEEPAFLLLGVRSEVGIRPAEVLGLDHPLDDNIFQALVGAVVDPCPLFQYEELDVDGKVVGVVTVLCNGRKPHYIRKDFGGLRQGFVYFRHGSKTDVATPEDIEDIYRERLRIGELELMGRYIESLLHAESLKLMPQFEVCGGNGGYDQKELHRAIRFTNHGDFAVRVIAVVWDVSHKTNPNSNVVLDAQCSIDVPRGVSKEVRLKIGMRELLSALSLSPPHPNWPQFRIFWRVTFSGADGTQREVTVPLQ